MSEDFYKVVVDAAQKALDDVWGSKCDTCDGELAFDHNCDGEHTGGRDVVHKCKACGTLHFSKSNTD